MEAVPDGAVAHIPGTENDGVSSTDDAPPLTDAVADAAGQPDDEAAAQHDDAAQLVSGCWGELHFAGSDVLLAVGMALLCLVQNPLTTAEISSAGRIGSSTAERALLVLSERRNPLFGHLLYNIPGTAGPDRPPLLASQLSTIANNVLLVEHLRWRREHPERRVPRRGDAGWGEYAPYDLGSARRNLLAFVHGSRTTAGGGARKQV